jgi:endonuclease G
MRFIIVLFLLPLSLLAQLRDSVYVKTDIYEAVYSEVLQQPKWVKYTVQCPDGKASRQGMDFYTVPGIVTSDGGDYAANVYDKGHCAPAADFNCTKEMLYKTFSYVNCVLQHERLNRGVWRLLEVRERDLASQGKVEVLIRPVYSPKSIKLPTGATIPDGFFKTIKVANKVEVYYFPNTVPTLKSYTEYLIK